MPNKTIYIRNDDVELWEQLPLKSEVIHKVLQNYKAKLEADRIKSEPRITPLEEAA